MRGDAFSSSTVAGPDLLIQSLFIHRHFAVPESSQESFFSRKRDEADAEKEREDDFRFKADRARRGHSAKKPRDAVQPAKPTRGKDQPIQASNLSWELGYAYSTPMSSHSATGGFEWEALPFLDMSVAVSLDSVPDQDYRHGRITLRFEYYHSLPYGAAGQARVAFQAKLHADEQEDDERDARAYYLNHVDGYRVKPLVPYRGKPRRKYMPPTLKPPAYEFDDDDGDPALLAAREARLHGEFPNIKAALVFSFDKHIRELPSFLALNQFQFGPDLSLAWTDATTYRLQVSAAGYSTEVPGFLAGLPTAAGQSTLLPSPSVDAFQPQFLAFPRVVVEEGITHDFSDQWSGEIHFNQVFYAIDGLAPAFGFAPLLSYTVAKRWHLGLGMDVIAGGAATTALGILNLGYLF